ncbi:ABC transporter ATP-binding protein [Thiorhodovibrio frisius]|uniref:ABC-type polysaccharide/polyol phosphate transport system, ATPase component n=1 Tax=Thiorhodovibrio frisius TaxID=631362 RepID=H8Z1U8_9GAMM|nr:ABC transporter ATP-binding protein [Thiorhodovibrio frisius]EIC22576.1 ABC-type polysaccharide/polyol phosphate transport system, ATPase component [Thiorhodovibrio frisius]WPL20017.1 Polysialic acid transport ATP-binding protein KpsT [Thiorhodovibrio frisius]
MIEVKNLYKRYHNQTHRQSVEWVLQDVNFTLPKGISLAIIGRNGAGKSTLMRLIGGEDHPDRGEVIRRCRVSWPIGVSGGFQGSMTGRQNLKFLARVHGYTDRIKDVIDFMQDFAEIGKAFDQPIKTYSSGMRSRFAFGVSLAFEFDVYLSDEATATGDAAFKEKAKQVFRERLGQASVIMVSHEEEILRDLCQAALWLRKGEEPLWFDDVNEGLKAYNDSVKRPVKRPAKTPAKRQAA